MKRTILILLAATAATPALAQSDPLAPIVTTPPVVVPDVPLAPPVIVRPVPTDWRGVFDAIRADRHDVHTRRLGDELDDGTQIVGARGGLEA